MHVSWIEISERVGQYTKPIFLASLSEVLCVPSILYLYYFRVSGVGLLTERVGVEGFHRASTRAAVLASRPPTWRFSVLVGVRPKI